MLIVSLYPQSSSGLVKYQLESELPYGTSHTSETWSNGGTNLLLYGEGSVLRIANINDPTNMVVVSEVRTGKKVLFIDISDDGSLAAVSDKTNTITLIGLQDPAQPVILGRYIIDPLTVPGGSPNGLSFIGNSVLIAAMSVQGIRALDISNPQNISVIGDYLEPGGLDSASDVEVLGNYAFVTDITQGVIAVDISDLTTMTFSAQFSGATNALHISIKGTRAYVSRRGDGVSMIDLDVSGSSAVMTDLGTIDPSTFPRGVSGGVVYRAEQLDNGLLAVADDSFQNGVVLLDISNTASPIVIGGTPRSMKTLSVNGNYAFSSPASFFHGIYAYKLDEQNMGLAEPPLEVDFMPLFTSSDDVDVSGNFVTISNSDDGAGMIIMDVSDPTNPIVSKWVNNIDTIVSSVKINNTIAMAKRSDSLELLDVTNLQNPVLLPGLAIPGGAYVQHLERVNANEVLVAAGSVGVRWVNLSNPLMPIVEGYWTEASNNGISRVAIENDLVVASSNLGVWLIDFTNRSLPVQVNSFNLSNEIKDIDIANGFLYIANSTGHLRIWDITTPANIQEVYVYIVNPLSTTNGVKVINNIAYLASGQNFGLVELDVTNPALPVFLSMTNTAGVALKVDANDDVLLMADADAGLKIWLDLTAVEIFSNGFEQ